MQWKYTQGEAEGRERGRVVLITRCCRCVGVVYILAGKLEREQVTHTRTDREREGETERVTCMYVLCVYSTCVCASVCLRQRVWLLLIAKATTKWNSRDTHMCMPATTTTTTVATVTDTSTTLTLTATATALPELSRRPSDVSEQASELRRPNAIIFIKESPRQAIQAVEVAR